MNWRTAIRWLLAVSVIVIFATVAAMSFIAHARQEAKTSIQSAPYNDMVRAAIDIHVEQSRSLFQVGLLLLGVLWGAVLATGEDRRITTTDYPEILMFVSANGVVALSSWWHLTYLSTLAGAYSIAGLTTTDSTLRIPNVFDEQISHLFESQFLTFRWGIGVVVLTLISAYMVKGDTHGAKNGRARHRGV